MHIRLKDDFIESDLLLGPMPDFNESFESFLRRKVAQMLSLTETQHTDEAETNMSDEASNHSDDQFIVSGYLESKYESTFEASCCILVDQG